MPSWDSEEIPVEKISPEIDAEDGCALRYPDGDRAFKAGLYRPKFTGCR
ncbi:hypothetical protein [Phormidium sp. CCY1219]|nr:hypothetical protein [Phormidium sp. CCY1219]MEB3829538.1 hypothetical protein [Phormidium sp. CCY1219]